jgi:apolipoprotein N-acyltransferase
VSLSKHPVLPYLLAALLGAGGVLCFAPFGLFWLAPMIWLGFFALLRRVSGLLRGAALGFIFGLGFFLTGVSWVYVSLSVFGGMPWWLAGLAAFLFCVVLACFPMLAGWLFKRWQPKAAWRQALLFAGLVATADWMRTWVFTGFPWLALGYSQTAPSPLAGFAPLLGVHGLSALVALSGAMLIRWRVGLPLFIVLFSLGYGLSQLPWTTPSGAPLTVSLVQGNVPQEMKFRPEAFNQTLRLYRDLVRVNPAKLIVLPESAIPALFADLPERYVAELKEVGQAAGGDLIVGAFTGGDGKYWNSAISLGHSPTQYYSKSHLVPFGETMPPGFSWLLDLLAIPMSTLMSGPAHQPPLNVAGQLVAINICYEDVFGHEIIRALPDAGILANLSNTAWFGQSLAQPQHLQIAQMRAAETGRPMLRATNTGMTAIVNAQGEVEASLPPFTQGVLRGEVQPHQGLTPYVHFGDDLVFLLVLLMLVLGVRRRHI